MNIQKTTEKIGMLKYLRYRDEIFTKFNHLLNDNQATRKRLQVIAEKGPAVCLATPVVRDTSCFAKEEKGPQRLQQIKHGLPLPALPLDGTLHISLAKTVSVEACGFLRCGSFVIFLRGNAIWCSCPPNLKVEWLKLGSSEE